MALSVLQQGSHSLVKCPRRPETAVVSFTSFPLSFCKQRPFWLSVFVCLFVVFLNSLIKMYLLPSLFLSSRQIPPVPRTPFLITENAWLILERAVSRQALRRQDTLGPVFSKLLPFWLCFLSLSKNYQQFSKPKLVPRESNVYVGRRTVCIWLVVPGVAFVGGCQARPFSCQFI